MNYGVGRDEQMRSKIMPLPTPRCNSSVIISNLCLSSVFFFTSVSLHKSCSTWHAYHLTRRLILIPSETTFLTSLAALYVSIDHRKATRGLQPTAGCVNISVGKATLTGLCRLSNKDFSQKPSCVGMGHSSFSSRHSHTMWQMSKATTVLIWLITRSV